MRVAPALLAIFIMLPLSALNAAADRVPATISLSEDWTGAEHYLRDPAVVDYRGKLYCFFESDDPSGAWPGYHGNLYYRTYEETGGLVSLGDVVSLTPTVSPFGGEHRNEKVAPIVYNDRLFLFWQSSDPAQVPNRDVGWVEILVKDFDGKEWSGNSMLNSPLEPYNDSQRGCNEFPYPCVLGGKLYVVWERNVQYDRYFYSDIWLRAYNGKEWEAPLKVSEATALDYNEGPSLGVFGDKLYIIWENISSRDPANWKWELKCRSYDGSSLGPVTVVATSTSAGFKDSFPRLVEFENPRSQQRELYAFWRVLGAVPGESLVRAALNYSRFDGCSWSGERTAATVMKAGRASALGKMSVTVFGGGIYLAWATTDDSVKTGEDFDIAYSVFDGLYWSAVKEATQSADESLPGNPGSGPVMMDPSGLPIGFSALEDWRPERTRLDNNPQLVEYRHRLYVAWRMIPDFNFYGKDVIYLRVLVDTDTDGDGVPDTQDAFPESPSDWEDTDGDGAGDNTDPSPYNPDIWLPGQKKEAPPPPSPAVGAAVLLVVSAGAAYFLRPTSKKEKK